MAAAEWLMNVFKLRTNCILNRLHATSYSFPYSSVLWKRLLFSTGEPHPFASQPKLEVFVSGSAASTCRIKRPSATIFYIGPENRLTCRTKFAMWHLFCCMDRGVECSRCVYFQPNLMTIRSNCPDGHPGDVPLSTTSVTAPAPVLVLQFLVGSLVGRSTSTWPRAILEKYPATPTVASESTSDLEPWPRKEEERIEVLSAGRQGRFPRHLRSVSRDRIVKVVMNTDGASSYTRTVELTVRCRTIFKYNNAQRKAA